MRASNKRCWAEVDLMALERNVSRIRTALPRGIRYIAVVKADAYGHGLPYVVPHLMQNNVDGFAVANVQEGAVIRELGGGWPVLILSPVLEDEYEYIVEYDLTPVVSTHEEVEKLSAFARHKKISIHLKIDTGMGRLGIWHQQAMELFDVIQKKENLNLVGICSHFSSSLEDINFTQQQRRLFVEIIKSLKNIDVSKLWIHVDNSGGLETFDHSGGVNAVRIGIIQFGVVPKAESSLKQLVNEPVLSFKTRVGLTKELPAGASVSYNRTHCLRRKSRIGILAAGYADGVDLGLSNKGAVIIRGRRCPIIGRVTMDQTIVDVTDYPDIRAGDIATLIGKEGEAQIHISEWSEWAGTIEWDVFCSLSKRVARSYLNAPVGLSR